jgi:glycosyltransferase involved in cell wall biosynthesis
VPIEIVTPHASEQPSDRPVPDRLLSFQIGISCGTAGAGGSGRVFADLIQNLPAHGIDVTGAVYMPRDIALRTAGRIRSFAPERSSTLGRLRGARHLIKSLLRQTRPDLVASHFSLYTLPVLEELRRQPLVIHFHGPWAAEASQEGASGLVSAVKARLERLVYRRACKVIVLSKSFSELLERDYGIDRARIRVVPGAVEIPRFAVFDSRVEARAKLGWPEDRRIFLAVRRLVSRMGLENLIAAMSPVCKRHPDILLYIAGRGRLREDLEARANAAGLGEHVRFLGYVPEEDLPFVYAAADLNVVPTLALEGFGMVAVEALAAGTPSIVTPVGGLPETVSGLSSDLIFAATSPDAIAEGLLRIAGDVVKLPSRSDCRSFAQQHFSIDRMAASVAAVYREACDR